MQVKIEIDQKESGSSTYANKETDRSSRGSILRSWFFN